MSDSVYVPELLPDMFIVAVSKVADLFLFAPLFNALNKDIFNLNGQRCASIPMHFPPAFLPHSPHN